MALVFLSAHETRAEKNWMLLQGTSYQRQLSLHFGDSVNDVNLGDWHRKVTDLVIISLMLFLPVCFLYSWSEDSRSLCTSYNKGPEIGESSAMYELHGKQKYKPTGNLCWRYVCMKCTYIHTMCFDWLDEIIRRFNLQIIK